MKDMTNKEAEYNSAIEAYKMKEVALQSYLETLVDILIIQGLWLQPIKVIEGKEALLRFQGGALPDLYLYDSVTDDDIFCQIMSPEEDVDNTDVGFKLRETLNLLTIEDELEIAIRKEMRINGVVSIIDSAVNRGCGFFLFPTTIFSAETGEEELYYVPCLGTLDDEEPYKIAIAIVLDEEKANLVNIAPIFEKMREISACIAAGIEEDELARLCSEARSFPCIETLEMALNAAINIPEFSVDEMDMKEENPTKGPVNIDIPQGNGPLHIVGSDIDKSKLN